MQLLESSVVLQSEASECGLACLAMVLRNYGHETDLRRMRLQFPSALRGMTLLDLVRAAEVTGLTAKAVRLEPEHLARLPLPAVLHWDMKHFVVLQELSRGTAVVQDPAKGRLKLRLEQVAEHFTGVAAIFEPGHEFKPTKDATSLRLLSLYRGVRGLRGTLMQLVGISLAIQLAAVLAPLLGQLAIDEALGSGSLGLIALLSGAMVGLALLRVVLGLAHGWGSAYLTAVLGEVSSKRLFRHLLRLPVSFFEARHTGDVQSRFEALDQIQTAVMRGLVGLWIDGAVVLGLSVAMGIYNVRLFAMVLLGSVLYAALRAVMHPKLRQSSDEAAAHKANETNSVIETLASIRMVKLAGGASQRLQVFDRYLTQRINAGVRTARQMAIFNALNTSIFGAVEAAVLFLSISAVLNGSMTLGMLFAFTAYQMTFINTSSRMLDGIFQLRLADVPLQRVADIVLSKAEPAEQFPAEAVSAQPTPALRLLVSDITIAYPGSPALARSINLVVEPGEIVAVCGRSGCGKTSLIKAACGLLELPEGEVRIGGRRVSAATRTALMRSVGVVLQQDVLLSGTIAENIAGFEDVVDMQKVRKVARIAHIHDDVESLPMGYYTAVTDMGSTFSGGQRQRMLLARALYRNPGLLLLDEATSSLDIKTEKSVLQAIRELGCSVLMVAHRPHALEAADRVIDLAAGA